MKHLHLILFSLLVASLGSLAQTPQRYTLKVNDFTHLEVDNNIRVDYYANSDSAGFIVFDATPELASRIYIADNGKGKVDIQCCADCTDNMQFPAVKIYSTQLNKIVSSSDSLVTVNNNPPVEKFEANLLGNGRLSCRNVQAPKVTARLATGSGQLTVTGNCTIANLSLTGVGSINADGLKAVKGKAVVMGTGIIGCDFSEELSISGIGSGRVEYRSLPAKIKSHALGIKHGLLNQ